MSAHTDPLRLALWQCAPIDDPTIDDADVVERNLSRLESVLVEVAGRADVLITPEMFVCGYRLDAAQARARADAVTGPIATRVAQLCTWYGVAVLYGCAELSRPSDRPDAEVSDAPVYNAIRLVDAGGRLLATHHKTHLFGDIDARAVSAGSQPPPVVEFDGWNLGLLTCYEVEFPEMVRCLAVRGADVVCVPTANMPAYDEVQRILLPARALENQVFLAYANHVGAEADLAYGGLSELLGPDGTVMVQGDRDEEVLYGSCDRAELDRSRAGHTYLADRRPDLY
ncbi:carbon-nitrogen hydrolase family protein [Gordonia desulfuricans]|uniref:Carbon-nitrogen hydrolase family protein n=1 Tax=Gordonia desulfuricans TaxID=89051 RepID=A0A7K3LLT1_9ACTN|nr:carbon-nitrogen hydrolase family protein [Gordonia desulfuricans]NDK88477.1 carbon-nitrogen hydrolase family protein [Gordonia desulfuricans]